MPATPPQPTLARQILHADLDAFFVACEVLRNPSLAGKPVIVGGSAQRGVVSSASYEARAFGVRSGMPSSQAHRLCPHAVFIHGSHGLYGAKSREVRQIVEEAVPVLEFASIDEFYADLTGMDRFFGAWQWARELRQRIRRETGLSISIALATSKTVSKIATNEAKPDGEINVPPGTEAAYLAPLPISRLPGAGEHTVQALARLGLHTFADVQRAAPSLLVHALGAHGRSLWKRAWGHCTSPVEAHPHEPKSIGAERTFAADSAQPAYLRARLAGVVEKAAYDLRRHGCLAGCVAIKMRYADFTTLTRQQHIPHTHADADILHAAQALFDANWQPGRALRLIGVRLTSLVEGGPQAQLFHNTARQESLLATADALRAKHGLGSLRSAATLVAKAPKPKP
jgi:DNA polymerase-4